MRIAAIAGALIAGVLWWDGAHATAVVAGLVSLFVFFVGAVSAPG